MSRNCKVFAFVSMGVDRKAGTGAGGALERGHGAPLECLAQLGDALGVVGAAAILEAAELVAGQAAKARRSVNGALTRKQTLEKARSAEWVLSGLIGERTLYRV